MPARSVNWQKPSLGVFKLNTDGAMDKVGGSRGVGPIIRDHNGALKAAVVMHAPSLLSVLGVELYGI